MNRNLSPEQFEDAPDHWTVDVDWSDHDALRKGITSKGVSRVLLSKEDHPDPLKAEETAALISMRHGGMATRVRHAL